MSDKNWSNRCTVSGPPLTLEQLTELWEQMMPRKKVEIRLHPEDELEFMEWAYRVWPAGREPFADPGSVSLLPEGVFQFYTRLDVAIRSLIVLTETHPRGKATICRWVFRVPKWLVFEPWLPIEEAKGPKVWEIEKFEILSFREEPDAESLPG